MARFCAAASLSGPAIGAPGDVAIPLAASTDEILAACIARARQFISPTVLSDAAIAEALGHAFARSQSTDPAAFLTTVCAPEIGLALACVRGDRQALLAFDTQMVRPARRALRKLGLDEATQDDIMQRLAQKVLTPREARPAALVVAAGQGHLAGFVHVAALRLGLTATTNRKNTVYVADSALFDALLTPVDAVANRAKLADAQLVKTAISEACAQLSARDRNLLRLSVVHGVAIDELARLYQVHRATAARWLERIRDTIRDAAKASLKARTGEATEQVESLMQYVRSRVDLTFERILGENTEDPSSSR